MPESLATAARSTLAEVFGHGSFRSCQQSVIERTLSGKHSLVIMPTGMGKSICYQVPALVLADRREPDRPPMGNPETYQTFCDGSSCVSGPARRARLTIVVSPLIALMKDQVDSLRAKGVSATFVNSSLRRDERLQRYEEIGQGHYDLLYVTPERFRKQDFLERLATRDVPLLAVDEAHCISEWGHDFRPDYTRLAEIRRLLGDPTTIALTATATPEVQADIIAQLGLATEEVRLFHDGIDRPNLRLTVERCWDDDDKLRAIQQVVQEQELLAPSSSRSRPGSGIIYFTLIKSLNLFSERLTRAGIAHVCYHGELTREQRKTIQSRFMQSEEPVVLATNAFGMGIDKEDIRCVIHAEIPGSMESYYQEIGRAGRDGRPSQCVLLYNEADLATQMQFLEWSNPDHEYYQLVYQFLTERNEEVRAFGLEWLNSKLQIRSKHDHRLATVLSILDRHGVIAGHQPPDCYEVLAPLPKRFRYAGALDEKKRRDLQKLLTLVEFTRCEQDHKAFIHRYFGLPAAMS